MAARVLHFGYDDCYRVQVLRSAGYAVTEAMTLPTLERDLQLEQVQAVILSEDGPRIAERAADIVRQRSPAPVILFRRSLSDLDEGKFDQVYSCYVPPPVWLSRTAELIAASRATRADSARLRRESKAIREESGRERARSLTEVARNRPKAID